MSIRLIAEETPFSIAAQYLCLEKKMIETASDLEMLDLDILRREKTE